MVRFLNRGEGMGLKCTGQRAIRYDWSITGDSTLGVCDQKWDLKECVVIYGLLNGEGELPNGLCGEISTLLYVDPGDQG